MLGTVITRILTAVHAEDTASDDGKDTLQLTECGVFRGPFHCSVVATAGGLDAVGVYKLHRRRAQHLECARQQPAVLAMSDLGAPLGFHGLTVAAPECTRRSPYSRLKQKGMRH